MKGLLLLVACIWAATPLSAQVLQPGASPAAEAVKPTLPAGPLLHSADTFSQWQISFTYSTDKKKDEQSNDNQRSSAQPGKGQTPSPYAPPDVLATRPRRTLTVKTGQIIHVQQTDVSGRMTDAWFDGITKYMKPTNESFWMPLDPTSVAHTAQAANYDPLPASGFRGMELVSEANYAGMMEYGGGACLVFAPGGYKSVNVQDRVQSQKQLQASTEFIYIDSQTRLPIAAKNRGELRTFHFESPPTAMQTLPADLLDEIKKGEEARARLLQPAARPY